MKAKIYPRFYQLYHYEHLLINKRVAGFYVPSQAAQTVVRKKGLYYQTFIIGDKSSLFVYKEFSLPTFLPFSKAKLRLYLDSLIKSLQDKVGVGGMAMEAYFQMCQSEDPLEIEQIRNALMQYCRLDTLAMVKILEKIMTTAFTT